MFTTIVIVVLIIFSIVFCLQESEDKLKSEAENIVTMPKPDSLELHTLKSIDQLKEEIQYEKQVEIAKKIVKQNRKYKERCIEKNNLLFCINNKIKNAIKQTNIPQITIECNDDDYHKITCYFNEVNSELHNNGFDIINIDDKYIIGVSEKNIRY